MTTADAALGLLRMVGSPEAIREGNLRYLREKYAVGFITFEELEQGVHNVLLGTGTVNVPRADPFRRWDHELREWVPA